MRILRMRLSESLAREEEFKGNFVGEARIFTDLYSEGGRRPIGTKRDAIAFQFGVGLDERPDVEISIRDRQTGTEFLEVSTWGTLRIQPVASNMVRIYSER
jgi:hypothetical protein